MMRLKRSRKIFSPKIDVNLTPLIDTALTLLIIFMVATPMMHEAIKVRLPQGESQDGMPCKEECIVTITKQGEIFFNNTQTSLQALGMLIKNYCALRPQEKHKVRLRADGASSCDMFIQVMESIRIAGGVQDVHIALAKKQAQSA